MVRRMALSLLLVAALALAAAPRTAAAGTGRDLLGAGGFVLAGLQIPPTVFHFVAAGKLNTELGGWTGDEDFERKARTAMQLNIAGGAVHAAKLVAWSAAGLLAIGDEDVGAAAVTLGIGALDMASAIMSITGGIVVLGAKKAAAVKGTPMGDAATWSGVVHLLFGGISALTTLPELLAGLMGVVAMAERDDRERPVRVAFQPGGIVVHGRF